MFLDFVIFLILEFGCWILGREIKFCKSLINLSNPVPTPKEKREKQKTEKNKNTKKNKYIAYRGLILFYRRRKDPYTEL